MTDCLDVCGAMQRSCRCILIVLDGLGVESALLAVTCHPFGFGLRTQRVVRDAESRHPTVETASLSPHQRSVGYLLDQGMPERIPGSRSRPSLEHDLRVQQHRQRTLQIRIVRVDDRLQERVRKLPAQNRRDLSDFLRRTKTVEPLHQRILQSRWHRDPRRRPPGPIAPLTGRGGLRFDQILRQLLGE